MSKNYKDRKGSAMVGVEGMLVKPLLVVNEDWSIGEQLAAGDTNGVRILLEPSKCYLDDEEVGLKNIIAELVQLFNQPKLTATLWQMHHSKKSDQGQGKTEFIAQNAFYETDPFGKENFKAWADIINQLHPPAKGHEWLFCNEKDHRFVMCDPDSVKKIDKEEVRHGRG